MKKVFTTLLGCVIIICFISGSLKAQKIQPDTIVRKISDYLLYRDQDTSYIQNYSDRISVKVYATTKYNYFKIKDRTNNTSVRYRPVRDVSLGGAVSYKGFAIDLGFSLGLGNNEDFKDSKAFDFRISSFSSKQIITANMMYYYGYKLTNYSGFPIDVKPPTDARPDIRTINFGMQYFYSFNYDKFSIKAPFVFNEVQKKSAGSIIAGASFSMFIMDADSSVIYDEFKPYFNPDLYVEDMNIISVALNGGYMYSFVYKAKYFLTLGLIPGINLNFGDYSTDTRHSFSPNVSFKVLTMNAIGYNGERIFGGIQFMGDIFDVRISKELRTVFGHGKLGVFIGYRFGKKS